jgi:hypothetical protein
VIHRVLICSILAAAALGGQETWETCSLTEGKGDGCKPSDRPRPFREFLSPGPWAASIGRDWFTGDFQFDVRTIRGTPTVNWREVCAFGHHRIREVRYRDGNGEFAGLLLAESSKGIFSPLMKWSGRMPEPMLNTVSDGTIIVLERNFGSNVPMMRTWAWMWAQEAPFRIDVDAAIDDAIAKLGEGYQGYNSGINWDTLSFRTAVWQGGYPGKTGVGEEAEVWFALHNGALVVTRANARKF